MNAQDIAKHRAYKEKMGLSRPVLPTNTSLLPKKVDLRPNMPPVYRQGALGSCTGNVVAAMIQHDLLRKNKPLKMPSRLFLYYNERLLKGTTSSDLGSYLIDGIKGLEKYGYCDEDHWPYDDNKKGLNPKFAEAPPPACYELAEKDFLLGYQRVPRATATLREKLASGLPVACGIMMFYGFYKAPKTGLVPLPGRDEKHRGAHAVLLCGYDDTRQLFTVRNSWGERWGDQGYCHLPYSYIMNPLLAHDFYSLNFK